MGSEQAWHKQGTLPLKGAWLKREDGTKGEGGGEGWRTFVCHVGSGRCPCLLRRELLGQAVALHEGVLLVGHGLLCSVQSCPRPHVMEESRGRRMMMMTTVACVG